MATIGSKPRKKSLPTQPQFVVQEAPFTNRFALLRTDEKGNLIIGWIGDPNAATKFNSKYEAKSRTRELSDIPETRVFKALEIGAAA
jgi:hypothetical protein